MGINLSESEWCRKATPEVPCRTQVFSHAPADSAVTLEVATSANPYYTLQILVEWMLHSWQDWEG